MEDLKKRFLEAEDYLILLILLILLISIALLPYYNVFIISFIIAIAFASLS